jgi:hypothetical protein
MSKTNFIYIFIKTKSFDVLKRIKRQIILQLLEEKKDDNKDQDKNNDKKKSICIKVHSISDYWQLFLLFIGSPFIKYIYYFVNMK